MCMKITMDAPIARMEVCAGMSRKKDGVREMKKMSDDEVWEALYGDD